MCRPLTQGLLQDGVHKWDPPCVLILVLPDLISLQLLLLEFCAPLHRSVPACKSESGVADQDVKLHPLKPLSP